MRTTQQGDTLFDRQDLDKQSAELATEFLTSVSSQGRVAPENFSQLFGQFFQDFSRISNNKIENLMNDIAEMAKSVGNKYEALMETVKAASTCVFFKISDMWDAIKEAVGKAFTNMLEKLDAVGSAIHDVVSEATLHVLTKVAQCIDTIQDGVKVVQEKFGDFMKAVEEERTSVVKANQELIEKMAESPSLKDKIQTAITSVQQTLKEAVKEVFGQLNALGVAAQERIAQARVAMAEALAPAGTAVFNTQQFTIIEKEALQEAIESTHSIVNAQNSQDLTSEQLLAKAELEFQPKNAVGNAVGNAVFYNTTTEGIQDFTGKPDLKLKANATLREALENTNNDELSYLPDAVQASKGGLSR